MTNSKEHIFEFSFRPIKKTITQSVRRVIHTFKQKITSHPSQTTVFLLNSRTFPIPSLIIPHSFPYSIPWKIISHFLENHFPFPRRSFPIPSKIISHPLPNQISSPPRSFSIPSKITSRPFEDNFPSPPKSYPITPPDHFPSSRRSFPILSQIISYQSSLQQIISPFLFLQFYFYRHHSCCNIRSSCCGWF